MSCAEAGSSGGESAMGSDHIAQRGSDDQALRNYIALAPYAAPRATTAAQVAAAHRATAAAYVRAAQVGAISATRAQRELAALWSATPATGGEAARSSDDGR